MSMIDYVRRDERDNIRPNPFWVQSQVMDFAGKPNTTPVMDDNEAVFMAFGKGDKTISPILIQGVMIEIIEAFIGGTVVMTIGNGTIPTYHSTDGDTVSVVTADSIAASAVVIPGTLGNKLVYPLAVPFLLIPADAVTPVLYAALTSDAAVTAGKVRINMLVSEIS